MTTTTATYTYTVYDADPAECGPCAWPTHDDVPIAAATLDEAREVIDAEVLRVGEACGRYAPGDVLYVQIWDADEAYVELRRVVIPTPDIDPSDYAVYDYRTASALDGEASQDLVEASLDAYGGTGAVAAYRDDDGLWQPLRDDEVETARRHWGLTVHIVYVQEYP